MNRFLLTGLAVLFVLFSSVSSGVARDTSLAGDIVHCKVDQRAFCRVFVVEDGDRSWTIAAQYGRELYPHMAAQKRESHIWDLLDTFGRLNPGVDLWHLRAGQPLELPLPYGIIREIDRHLQHEEGLGTQLTIAKAKLADAEDRVIGASVIVALIVVVFLLAWLWKKIRSWATGDAFSLVRFARARRRDRDQQFQR